LSLVTILSGCEINNFAGPSAKSVCYNLVAMFDLFRLWLGAVLRGFRTRRSLMLENLALRQQLAVFKRQQPRPRLGAIDKLFWVVARRFWAQWKKTLFIVCPASTILSPRVASFRNVTEQTLRKIIVRQRWLWRMVSGR
jgi:hypothetical protein